MKNKLLLALAGLVACSLLLTGCLGFTNPETGKTGPSWDVPLAVPLLDDRIVLEDILEDQEDVVTDPNSIRFSTSLDEEFMLTDDLDLDTTIEFEVDEIDLSIDDIDLESDEITVPTQKETVELEVEAPADDFDNLSTSITVDIDDVDVEDVDIEDTQAVDLDSVDLDDIDPIEAQEDLDFDDIDFDNISYSYSQAIDFGEIDLDIPPEQETIDIPLGIDKDDSSPVGQAFDVILPDQGENTVRSLEVGAGTIAVSLDGIDDAEFTADALTIGTVVLDPDDDNQVDLAGAGVILEGEGKANTIAVAGTITATADIPANTQGTLVISFDELEIAKFSGVITQDIEFTADDLMPTGDDFTVESITFQGGSLDVTITGVDYDQDSLAIELNPGANGFDPTTGLDGFVLGDTVDVATSISVDDDDIASGDQVTVEVTFDVDRDDIASFQGESEQTISFDTGVILPDADDFELEAVILAGGSLDIEVTLTSGETLVYAINQIQIDDQVVDTNSLAGIRLEDNQQIQVDVEVEADVLKLDDAVNVNISFSGLELAGFEGWVEQDITITGSDLIPAPDDDSYSLESVTLASGKLDLDPSIHPSVTYTIQELKIGGQTLTAEADGSFDLTSIALSAASDVDVRVRLETKVGQTLDDGEELELTGSLTDLALESFSGTLTDEYTVDIADVWPDLSDEDVDVDSITLAAGLLSLTSADLDLDIDEITIDGKALPPSEGGFSLAGVALTETSELVVKMEVTGTDLAINSTVDIEALIENVELDHFTGSAVRTETIDVGDLFDDDDLDADFELDEITLDALLKLEVLQPATGLTIAITEIWVDSVSLLKPNSAEVQLTDLTLTSDSKLDLEILVTAVELEQGADIEIEASLADIDVKAFTGTLTQTETVLGSDILPEGDASFQLDEVLFKAGYIQITLDTGAAIGLTLALDEVIVKNPGEPDMHIQPDAGDPSKFPVADVRISADTALDIQVRVEAQDADLGDADLAVNISLLDIDLDFEAAVQETLTVADDIEFKTDDYDLHSVEIKAGELRLVILEPEQGLRLVIDELVITRSNDDDQDLTPAAPEVPVDFTGVILEKDSEIQLKARVIGEDFRLDDDLDIRAEAVLEGLEVAAITGVIDIELTMDDLDLETLELDYELPEGGESLLKALRYIDITLELSIDNPTGVAVDMDDVRLAFTNAEGETAEVAVSDSTKTTENDITRYTFTPDRDDPDNCPIMQALRLVPREVEILGRVTAGGGTETDPITADVTKPVNLSVSFGLAGTIEIDVEQLDPVITPTQEFTADPDAAEALKDFTNEVLFFVDIENRLPLGAKITIEFADEDTDAGWADAHKVELKEIRPAIKDDQGRAIEARKSNITFEVDEALQDIIARGAYIRVQVDLLGEDNEFYQVAGSDYLDLKMWAEVKVKINQ